MKYSLPIRIRNKRQEVNESLTKKKYCQSAKLFYQVFSSLLQYDSFLRFVSKTKKYIFRIIFKLFLDALPSETKFKLPEELWEKIWKFSQNAHFRYRSEVRNVKEKLLLFKPTFPPHIVGSIKNTTIEVSIIEG